MSGSSMGIEADFWKLVDKANCIDEEASRILKDDTADPVDVNRMLEPTYLAICQLVTDHPGKRDVFVRCFSELVLYNRPSPWCLVPFCMRVLRLAEVKEVLSHDMDAHRGTAYYATRMNYCSAVMHAYLDDVWEMAIEFDYFSDEVPSCPECRSPIANPRLPKCLDCGAELHGT